MITSYYTTKLGLEPETITYKNRVEADGGEVIDLAYVDSVYKKVKELGLLSNLLMFTSHRAGVKKDVNNAVSKMFSLDNNANDGIQNTASKQPIYNSEGIVYDGVDDFMDYGNKQDFIDITNQLTIESRIKPIVYQSRGTVLTRIRYFYLQLDSNQKLAAYLYGTSNEGYHVNNDIIPNNTFSNVGYTYNGSSLIFYFNGNNSGNISTSGDIKGFSSGSDNDRISVGAELNTDKVERYINANIQYSRLFNTALTQQQITELNAL